MPKEMPSGENPDLLAETTSKKKNPYHFDVGVVENKEAFAILSQIRLVDTKRLHSPLAVLSKEKFKEIKKAIEIFFR